MMFVRYWLAYQFIKFGLKLIPDLVVKQALANALAFTGEMLRQEMKDDSYDEDR